MSNDDGNQIIGCMRFSYISKGGFKHSHDTQEEQEAMIYDADRMERRFQLFEFNDQPWLPAALRDATTGFLDAISRVAGFHKKMAPIVSVRKAAALNAATLRRCRLAKRTTRLIQPVGRARIGSPFT